MGITGFDEQRAVVVKSDLDRMSRKTT